MFQLMSAMFTFDHVTLHVLLMAKVANYKYVSQEPGPNTVFYGPDDQLEYRKIFFRGLISR